MSKLLEQAIELLRELPKEEQDTAARALILQLDQECELSDRGEVDLN